MIDFSRIIIALGSNLSCFGIPPDKIILSSLQKMEKRGYEIISVSRLYKTPSFPIGEGPDYVNAVARLSFSKTTSPYTILRDGHDIEASFGRLREKRWGQRTLDIDLLAIGSLVLPDLKTHKKWVDLSEQDQLNHTPDQLVLPHPRIQDRAFALVPLADIMPEWVHPTLGKSVSEMLKVFSPEEHRAILPL